jgi:hypothetical protein
MVLNLQCLIVNGPLRMTLKLLSTSFTLWYKINISTLSWTYFSDQCQTTALIHVVKSVDEREFLIITQSEVD